MAQFFMGRPLFQKSSISTLKPILNSDLWNFFQLDSIYSKTLKKPKEALQKAQKNKTDNVMEVGNERKRLPLGPAYTQTI